MLQGVNLEEVRQYNTSLKQYRDKAANINAQLEFTKNELSALCQELSKELGVEVNESNVEQIYAEQVDKINSTLKSGNAVLSKIASEEQRLASGVPSQTTQATQVASEVTPMNSLEGQPSAVAGGFPQAPVPPQDFLADTGAAGTLPGNSVPGTLFGTPQAAQPLNMGGTKLFSLGAGHQQQ